MARDRGSGGDQDIEAIFHSFRNALRNDFETPDGYDEYNCAGMVRTSSIEYRMPERRPAAGGGGDDTAGDCHGMVGTARKETLTTKYKKTPILAWLMFGAIVVLTLLNLVMVLMNREPNQSILQLAADASWIVLPAEFAFLAALILSRQPRNTIGWLVMMPAIASASDSNFQGHFNNLTAAPSAPTPAFLLTLWFSSWSWLLIIFPLLLILLLFPTGQPPSPRWRWAILYVLGVCAFFFIVIAFQKNISPQGGDWWLANSIGFIPVDWFEKYLIAPYAIGLLSTTALCVISMVVRYRRASVVEREQIKWLMYASGLFAATYIIAILFNLNSEEWGAGPAWVYFLNALGAMSLPIAIGIAILYFRLWDIDILIRRTLVYTALTATLALVYFASVVILQELFQVLTGQGQSQVVTVVSTLAIAALFTPLRGRIQNGIDRRFYRRKFDAQKTLQDFTASLRDEVDLEALGDRLLAVVEGTMQPERVSLLIIRTSDDRPRSSLD